MNREHNAKQALFRPDCLCAHKLRRVGPVDDSGLGSVGAPFRRATPRVSKEICGRLRCPSLFGVVVGVLSLSLLDRSGHGFHVNGSGR